MNTPCTPFSPPAHFWKQSGWSLFQLVMNGLIKSALVIASYFLIKSASAGIRSDSLVYSESVWILSLVAFSFIILRVHERYTSEKMSQKYINRVRSVLLKRLMRASVRSVQTMSVGAMSSRLGGDLSAVKKWLSLGIARLISHGLLLSIFSLLMININLYLGLVMLFSMGLLVTVSMIIGKQLKTSIKSVRKNRIKIHSMLVERLSSIITIRALGQELSEI
ncbi:MAG: ABC transporter ATP-binding protein, partial [Xanthomonadales bacterium]|nr:ABC transporter ATP-binding protein [Xanthomonadales bacterium]